MQKLIALMLGGTLASAEFTASLAQTTGSSKPWDVKYEAGNAAAGIKRGASMKVSIEPAKIVLEGKNAPSILIPVTELADVTYDITAQSRIRQARNAADTVFTGPCGDLSLGGCMALDLIGLGVTAAVLAPFKSRKHYVNVIWSDGKEMREVIVELKKNKYQPFLEEIHRVTGKMSRDLPAAAEKIRKELDLAKDQKIGIRIDRKAWVGNTILDPRSYQIVVLGREENQGEIYFFAGDSVNTKKIAAATMIEIVATQGVQTPDITYSEIDGLKTTISEIRVSSQTLKLRTLR